MEALRNNADIVQHEGYYYILGDSRYARSSVLLTPILDAPEGYPASLYTEEHYTHTRCQVERTIGILTGTWKVISRSRKLYYSSFKVSRIVNVAVILHNFLRVHGAPNVVPNEYVHENHEHNIELRNGEEEMNRILRLY